MPRYMYKARDPLGQLVTEQIDAPSEQFVRDVLMERQLILVSIEEMSPSAKEQLATFFRHVGVKELVVFSRQLAVLVSATVPIVRALRILAKQTESKSLRIIIADIADEVDGGARLSSAMHRHKQVFDDFFVYMVRSGETTGRLDEVLTYLADQKEKDYALRSRIVGAMIYPAFIVLVLVGMFIFMMIYVIPKLLDVVTSTGAELPLPTKLLLATSSAFQNYWWLGIIGLFCVIGTFIASRRIPAVNRFFDRVKLYIPVFGKIFRMVYLARISQSLANLLAAGVPVNRSISIVADVSGNAVYREILLQTQDEIEGGQRIAAALSKYKQIPPMMSQMMDIGEETGRLDEILGKIAHFYSEEVKNLTDALASLIEPMIIILLGAGALVLVTGVLMPIYSITAQF